MKKEIVSIKKHGVQWQTTCEYQFLIDVLDSNLSRVDKKDVVKSSSIRRVVSLKIPRDKEDLEIFVKHHRLTWKETLKDLLHISKAQNEWKLTHQISSFGINTVLPLAIGEKREAGLLRESYFISKRIDSCETLHQFVLRKAEEKYSSSYIPFKREMIRKLALLIAEIHKKGIEHHDLHAGNILIEWTGKDYRLSLLDLDRAQIHTKLSLRKRIIELAQFNMFFTLFVSKADRLRFFKEYYKQDPLPWHGYQQGAKKIEEKTLKIVNNLYHKRDKLCLRTNKYFEKFETPPYYGFYRKEWKQDAFREFIQKPRLVLGQTHTEALKKASEKTVRVYPIKTGSETVEVVIKSYKTTGLLGRFKNLFRASRARKSWYAANALFQRKISTAYPIACITKKKWGIVQKSYFISEYLPQASVLSLFLEKRFLGPLSSKDRKLKRNLLIQLALFVRKTHQLWIYHGDLKASNILIQENKDEGFQFYLIDLDHVKVCCQINRYQRYRNLMQLNKSFLNRKVVSMTDRLLFVKTYLGTDSREKRKLQRAWTVVSHLTGRRLRKTDKAFSS